MGSLDGGCRFEWKEGAAQLGDSEIAAFYQNRSVFLTGATGFIGKGLLEKLLRACPEVRCIYILLRPKRGVDVRSRLSKLLESTLFKSLTLQNPGILNKVVPIPGDLSLPDLGLSQESQQLLQDQVSVVINSAATVKFDEKLKLAFNINTMGTQRMITLCRKMKQLVVLVHVSTAYANSDQRTIGEFVYPTTVDPKNLAECLGWMSDKMVDTITPMLITPKPNTYTFTKSLAEHILKENDDLPICIIRPSIVVSTWKEPEPGWVDNFNSATGPIAANGMGVLSSLPSNPIKIADFSPLDLTVNMILAASWNRTISGGLNFKPIEVYNCCSGTVNPLLWKSVVDWSTEFMRKYPLSGALWYPGTGMSTGVLKHTIMNFVWHYIPTHFLYLFEYTFGKPKGMKKLYRDVSKIRDLRPFTTEDWTFETRMSEQLFLRMSARDKELFNFNVREVSWEDFMENYCHGIRKYLFKEDDDTLPKARERMNRLKWIRNSFRLLLILGCIWIFLQFF